MLRKILTVSLALTLLITGCAKSSTRPAEVKELKLGVLPIEDNLPLYVAENRNLFTEAGIKVKLVNFDSALERDVALQAGQIDGEVADLVAVALLKKGGTDVHATAIGLGANPKEGRFALLAAPHGKVKRITDLRNVPVAISENSIIEYVTDNLLLQAGLKQSEIKKVAIPSIPARMEALLSGKIEAAVIPDPLATLASHQGARVIADDTKVNLSQTVLVFRKQVIDENRDAVTKIVKVYGEAGQELTAHPDTYRKLFIEKARVPAPISETYYSPTFSPLQAPTKEEVSQVMDWMYNKKLLEKPYTYQDIVDTSLLPK